MSFAIDKQTLEELNILGKFKHGTVYSVFNKVKTRGGERLLEEMFRNPLDNETAVNERSGIIRYFQDANLVFPFDAQQVALMREYLDTGTGKGSLSTYTDTFIKKTLSSITRDERYKKDILGLQAVIAILNRCHAFVQTALPVLRGSYQQKLKQMQHILDIESITRLRNTDIYTSMSMQTIASYAFQLKNKLAGEMENLLAFIYELDVFISVSDVARTKGFTYAEALPANVEILNVEGLYHPSVDNAVGNGLQITENKNVLFLTGANMAGKSTFMKSVGIGVYLAHMGFPVPAVGMKFSIRDGMYTSINVADNIQLGYSHFYAEVVRVKQAAEAVATGKRLLLMFDELFKGTNVKDAYDGTLSVTDAFSDFKECLFIVSTHIIEVGHALKNKHNIYFAFMPTIMNGNRPMYTYQLQEGITEDRQGMMIIRNEGILEMISQ